MKIRPQATALVRHLPILLILSQLLMPLASLAMMVRKACPALTQEIYYGVKAMAA